MKIIKLNDGDQIAESGAYKCSMDLYHSQAICPGPSISSTGLRTIFSESPWHFWARSDLNPDRYPEKEASDSLNFGKAAHALILGDEVFAEQFIFVPDDAPPAPTAAQIAAREAGRISDAAKVRFDFWDEFEIAAAGRLLIGEEAIQRIQFMAENIAKNPEAMEALTGGLTEISMIWQDPITGVWIKARPDQLPSNGYDFADLKTLQPRSKSIERAVHQSITEYRYDMQKALAVMGAEHVFGRTAKNCILIFAQSNAPFTVTPVRITEDTLYWARCCCRQAIDTFAKCLEAEHWPMPVEGILDYSLPPSMVERYAQMQCDGLLPNLEA